MSDGKNGRSRSAFHQMCQLKHSLPWCENYAEGICREKFRIYRYGIYGYEEVDRRICGHNQGKILSWSIQQSLVSFLRKTMWPDKRSIVGGWRIYPSDQTTVRRQIPMTEKWRRCQKADGTGDKMAAGGAWDQPAPCNKEGQKRKPVLILRKDGIFSVCIQKTPENSIFFVSANQSPNTPKKKPDKTSGSKWIPTTPTNYKSK